MTQDNTHTMVQIHQDFLTPVRLDLQKLGAQRDPVPVAQRSAFGHEVVVHIHQARPYLPAAALLLYLNPPLQQYLQNFHEQSIIKPAITTQHQFCSAETIHTSVLRSSKIASLFNPRKSFLFCQETFSAAGTVAASIEATAILKTRRFAYCSGQELPFTRRTRRDQGRA